MNKLHLLMECSGTSIIVTGCSGCGKSTLVKAFARHFDDNRLLVIHLGEQIDSKVCERCPWEGDKFLYLHSFT